MRGRSDAGPVRPAPEPYQARGQRRSTSGEAIGAAGPKHEEPRPAGDGAGFFDPVATAAPGPRSGDLFDHQNDPGSGRAALRGRPPSANARSGSPFPNLGPHSRYFSPPWNRRHRSGVIWRRYAWSCRAAMRPHRLVAIPPRLSFPRRRLLRMGHVYIVQPLSR